MTLLLLLQQPSVKTYFYNNIVSIKHNRKNYLFFIFFRQMWYGVFTEQYNKLEDSLQDIYKAVAYTSLVKF